jgi:hypothetical protein
VEPTTPVPTADGCVTIEPSTRDDGTIDWTATRTKLQTAYAGFPADPETGAPAYTAAYNTLWEQEQERSILARMQEIDGKIPGTALTDWTPQARGSAAYVVDAELAKSKPCTRLDLGDSRTLVFAEGVIGALGDDQVATLCPAGFEDRVPPPAIKLRLNALVDAVPVCSLAAQASAGDPLDAYYGCLGSELRKKGVTP